MQSDTQYHVPLSPQLNHCVQVPIGMKQ
uniref:Uncharacterized protein n=1 Tax=Anguilla anguilla TaxID=7936 RepID=A0A0E9PYW1_ANGAN